MYKYSVTSTSTALKNLVGQGGATDITRLSK